MPNDKPDKAPQMFPCHLPGALFLALACLGCSSEQDTFVGASDPVPSGVEGVDARILELRLEDGVERTEVIVRYFVGDQTCARGAVFADGFDLDLEIRWIDKTVLEVRSESGVLLHREFDEDRLSCLGHGIDVHLVSQ